MKSHSDKNTKQPKLRFPGFTGEWVEKRLGDVGKITTGSTPSTFVEEYYNGEYLFVSPFDISDKKYIITTQKTLTVEGFKKTRNIKKGSVLFVCIGSTIGKIAVAGTDLATNQQINAITCEDQAQNEFVYYSLLKKAGQIKLMAGEQAVPILNKSNFETVKLPMTSPAEQNKIADFLSDIDTKIEKLTRKKELTEQYKKGAMQKIFSQKIRFKDENGKNYPDWEEKKLGDVADIFDGTHLTPDYTSSGIPFYSVENVMSNNFSDTKYISEEVYIKECKRIKIEKGDILMTKIGNIGTSRYVDWEVEASFYVSLALIKQSKRYNSKYLSQYIMTARFQENLHKKTIHVAFPKKINLGEIGKCCAEFPCLEEQKKISDFLIDLDTRIEHIKKELAKLKEFKKGLLQGMFV